MRVRREGKSVEEVSEIRCHASDRQREGIQTSPTKERNNRCGMAYREWHRLKSSSRKRPADEGGVKSDRLLLAECEQIGNSPGAIREGVPLAGLVANCHGVLRRVLQAWNPFGEAVERQFLPLVHTTKMMSSFRSKKISS
jgi:hypothetical protein